MGVVGRIFPNRIEHVVVRHDAHKPILVVDHRNREEVEAGKFLHHLLARLIEPHANRLGFH